MAQVDQAVEFIIDETFQVAGMLLGCSTTRQHPFLPPESKPICLLIRSVVLRTACVISLKSLQLYGNPGRVI